MKFTVARNWLAGTFLLTYLVGALCVIVPFTRDEMNSSSVGQILLALTSIYAVHFSVIVGGSLAQGQAAENKKSRTATFVIALAFASVWNALVVWRLIAFTLNADDAVPALLAYLVTVPPATSFLIAAFLAHFFVKPTQ